MLIDENLHLAYCHHNYTMGEEILILTNNPAKLDPWAKGPYVIHEMHANGMVSYFKTPHVLECINIRRIKPFIHAHASSLEKSAV